MTLGADTSMEFTSWDLSLTTSTCGVGGMGGDLRSDIPWTAAQSWILTYIHCQVKLVSGLH